MYDGELSENEFKLYLSKFLFSPKGASYQAHFRFERDLECGIPASEILVKFLLIIYFLNFYFSIF